VKFEVAKALAQARSYGLCEGCRALTTLDPHHRMTRGSGGVHRAAADVSNDPRNLLMLCRVCHDLTLSDAGACMLIGWVVERRAGVDPRDIPAKIHTVNGYGWWFLTEDGGYRWADELNIQPDYVLSYTIEDNLCPHGVLPEYCGNCHEETQ
jgi:hypothetical protein